MAHKPLSFEIPEGLPRPLMPEPTPLIQKRRRPVPFPRQRGRIPREIDPLSEHYVAGARPARHHLQNGMKTVLQEAAQWVLNERGQQVLKWHYLFHLNSALHYYEK